MPDFQDKFTNPKTLYEGYQAFQQNIGGTLEERSPVVEAISNKLDSYQQAIQLRAILLNQEKQMERLANQRLMAEKEFDKLLTKKNPNRFIKEMESLGIMKKNAEDLVKLAKTENAEKLKSTKLYKDIREEAVKTASAQKLTDGFSGPSKRDAAGGAMAGAMAGSRFGGTKGALAGGSIMSGGVGQFAMDLLNSLGPGGTHPAEVIKGAFPGLPPGLAKGLGALAGSGGYVTAGLMAYNQLQSRIGDPLRSAELAGQQVGGGVAAGTHMRLRTFQLGMNPFDAITNQIAQQIVQGTTGAGFKGRQADQIENAAKSVYLNTGMSVENIIKLTSFAIRDMGLSVKETEIELKSFHENLKDSNMSLEEYTARVTSTAGLLATSGQGPSALKTSQGLNKLLGPPFQQGQLDQLLQNPLFQAQLGTDIKMPAQMALGAATPQQIQRSLGRQIQQQRKISEGMARQTFQQRTGREPNATELRHEEANVINAYGLPQFRGLGVPQIEQLLTLSSQNQFRHIASQQDRVENYTDRYKASMRGAKKLSSAQIKKAQDILSRSNNQYVPGVPFIPKNAEELALYNQYGIMPGHMHEHGQMVGHGKDSHIEHRFLNDRQEKNWRRMRLESLKRDVVGSHMQNIDEFRKHLYDPNFDWSAHLQSAKMNKGRVKGQTVDVQTDQGTVVIKLDPKTKSWYLEKDEKAKANNAGYGNRNDNRPYIPPKTASDNARSGYGG